MMNRKRIAVGKQIPAVLAAAIGIAAVGLFTTPVASGQEPGQPGQCSQGQFPTADGTGCASVPDPTKYGCPPKDFKCMFDSIGPPKG
jgi:hypothetical protein